MTFRVSSKEYMILFCVSVEQCKVLIDLCREFGATSISSTHFEFREDNTLKEFQSKVKSLGLL